MALFKDAVAGIAKPDSLLKLFHALSVAFEPDSNYHKIDQQLQEYADTVRNRVKSGHTDGLLAHLHSVLFDEECYATVYEDYTNHKANLLAYAIQNKHAMPIALAVIYLTVARRLGLKCFGANIPGRFMVGVQMNGTVAFVDVSEKGVIRSRDEIEAFVLDVFNGQLTLTDGMLQPVGSKVWVTRAIQNMLNQFGSEENFREIAAALELETILWPDEMKLHRDLALVLSRNGMMSQAYVWLTSYLNTNPDDVNLKDLKHLQAVLKSNTNGTK